MNGWLDDFPVRSRDCELGQAVLAMADAREEIRTRRSAA